MKNPRLSSSINLKSDRLLGCTEIGLLVQQADTPVPLFDTTEIHAEQAVQWALESR
ncbi:hypothetical protein [Halomonas sp. NyZ770]|uniref:hypothetical protein n=1 Tax=Halomonas sp. NyZ770 TaxID=2883106 RepID=UPI00406C9BDC